MVHSWCNFCLSAGCNVGFHKYSFPAHVDTRDRPYTGSRYCMDMKEGKVGVYPMNGLKEMER